MSDTLRFLFRSLKSRSGIVRVTFLVAVIAMLGSCKKSNSDTQQREGFGIPYRFVFLADSRGDSLKHPINTEVLTAIIKQIGKLEPRPSFIVFGGDMAYRGYIDTSYTFLEWKQLFAPLTDGGIVLYTTVGNHELYYEHSALGFMLGNQEEFKIAFSENPANGPAGYEHLTYSFTSPDSSCFFAVLDPYYLTHDTIPNDLGGHIDATQMSWLSAQVAQTKATHKFLFIHTPYYYISDDPDEISSADTSYTKLWAFLDSSKFDFYACGHSHLFARRTIDNSVHPNPQTTPPTPGWQNNVVQLLNGTSGAGPSTGAISPDIKALWNVHNDAKTYYFSVIDVYGSTVRVSSYSGYTAAYSGCDSFTITK